MGSLRDRMGNFLPVGNKKTSIDETEETKEMSISVDDEFKVCIIIQCIIATDSLGSRDAKNYVYKNIYLHKISHVNILLLFSLLRFIK